MPTTREGRLQKGVLVAALAVGIAAGSYGVASAASGDSGSGSNPSAAPTTPQSGDSTPPGHPGERRPCGGQRSDETPLTGVAASKVEAAAKAEVPGGTVVRVEIDADGHAAYEAHMTDADGAPVTVYVDEDFGVVSVERR